MKLDQQEAEDKLAVLITSLEERLRICNGVQDVIARPDSQGSSQQNVRDLNVLKQDARDLTVTEGVFGAQEHNDYTTNIDDICSSQGTDPGAAVEQ